jgi:hypothetical protein
MKKKYLLTSLAVLLAATLFNSCTKNGAAPSSSAPEVLFGIKSDNALTTLAATPNAGSNGLTTNSISTGADSVTWNSGIANIARFQFEAKKHNTEVEINSKNLTNVDLFAITPSLIGATIDTGTYKEIEIRIVFEKTTSTALPLVLKGTFKSAGTAVPIELDFNDNAVIKAQSEDVVVDQTKDLATTFSMHLNKLLAGVSAADIDAATRTNDSIIISDTVNISLYNIIKANVTSSCESKGFEKRDKSEREKGK